MFKDSFTCTATDFVVYPPIFVTRLPKIKNPLTQTLAECFDRIIKIDRTIKKDLIKFSKTQKRRIMGKNYDKPINFSVLAYPKSDINEILKIMKSLELTSIPVVKNPWNKKLIGYLKRDEIEKELNSRLPF